jgi:hypothetical protein
MAGRRVAAKQIKLPAGKATLSRAAQARIGLELVDDRHKIIKPDDPFELEPCAGIARPDNVGFDPPHHRQANDDTVAPLELAGIIYHEAVGRQVADMQMQIAVHEMLNDRRKINRMPRCTPQIGYAEIGST